AGTDERDVVLALRAQDLPDRVEQELDRVTHPALAELAEVGQVAADLRRVDVRVLGDLLRRDPRLAHLPCLRQHLEVPGQAGGGAAGQALGHPTPLPWLPGNRLFCSTRPTPPPVPPLRAP